MARTATCKYCGAKSLTWRKVGEQYYLADYYNPSKFHFETCAYVGERQRERLRIAVGKAELPDIPQNEPVTVPEPTIVQVVPENRMREIAQEEIRNSESLILDIVSHEFDRLSEKLRANREIEIHDKGEVRILSGRQHRLFETALQFVIQRVHLMLVGPAAGGKTTAAGKMAEALNFRYFEQSCNPQMTSWDLLGFMNAAGTYIRSAFREAYENGGLFMLDEIDASNGGILVAINSAIANGHCQFPDGMIARHKDFVLVAGANTYGRGADRIYSGRQQLDGATLDRFAVLDWDYDEDAEIEWAGNVEWTRFVQRARKIANDHKFRVVISPRCSIGGAKMLAAGMSRKQVEESFLWKGIDSETRRVIEANLTR